MVLVRFDPESETVKSKPEIFETYECDVCGSLFARKRFRNEMLRTCSDVCDDIWKRKGHKRKECMDLFIYKVKFVRDFKIDKEYPVFDNFTPIQMEVMMALGYNSEKGKDIYWIIDRIYGTKHTRKGYTCHRSTVYKALRSLALRGLIRIYSVSTKGNSGRPRKRYVLKDKPVSLDKKCPYCESKNFSFLETSMIIRCMQCGLEWNL